MSMFARTRRLAAAAVLAAAAPVIAIQPQTWVHDAEADFAKGETDGTVVTNLGDVKLAAGHRPIAELPDGLTAVYDIAIVGEAVYLAAGPVPTIVKVADGEAEVVTELDGEQAFALFGRGDAELLIALSSEAGSRVAMLDGGELKTVIDVPGARYIWDITAAGLEVWLATGTEGQVFRAFLADDRAVAAEPIFDAGQANVLTLAKGPEGEIYAGTDTEGLVYRLTPGKGGDTYTAYVAYDADEAEIASLLVAEDGTVYAGTADAEGAKPGRLDKPEEKPAGRPAPATQEAEEPADDPADEAEDAPEDAPEEAPEEAPDDAPEDAPADEPEAPAVDDAAAADPGDAPAEPKPVTPEQRDRLREMIRERLAEARRTGTLTIEGDPPTEARPTRAASTRTASPPPGGKPASKKGNAVYAIDSRGFVREVFRDSVMVLALAPAPGDAEALLVGTGNEGQVYRVDLDTTEKTVLADLDAAHVATMTSTRDGVLLGTANTAGVYDLRPRLAEDGTYTSIVLDASQVSLWGVLRVVADVPEGALVKVTTRSGNVSDPEQAPWSPWAEAGVLEPSPDSLAPRELEVASPPARFLQYRLSLAGSTEAAPAVGQISLAYVMPNLPPAVTRVAGEYAAAKKDQPPPTEMKVSWEAGDPNGDALSYTLEYQPAGSERWLTIAEDVTDTSYTWETRRVPDGRYTLRLTATDASANPADMALRAARVSDPVLVDNTPPSPGEIGTSVDGRSLTLSGTVTDALSPVRAVAYAVDSDDDYRPVLPEDLIYDSTRESWTATLRDLARGPHVVTLRFEDARGNTTYRSVTLEID